MTDINVGGLEAKAQPETGLTVVSEHQGLVVLHFQKALEYAVYSPAGAISDGAKMLLTAAEADPNMGQLVMDVARAVIDGIYSQRGDLKPVGGAALHEMKKANHARVSQRIEIMLNTTRTDRKVSNKKFATDLADAAFKIVY